MESFQPKNQEEYIKIQESHHTDNFHEYPLSPWHKNIFEEFKKYLASPVLDIGCRNGLLLDELEKQGVEAWGIEITDIAKWAQFNKRKVIQEDIQKRTVFPDKFFKSAVMTHCIEHLHDPKAALKEIKRIVDGYIFIAFPTQNLQVNDGIPKDTHYTAFESMAEMVKFLEDNELEVIWKHEGGWADNEVIAKL